MTASHLPRSDPAAVAEAALALLRSGRPDAAERLLESLPGLIREALAEAVEAGRTAALDDPRGFRVVASRGDG